MSLKPTTSFGFRLTASKSRRSAIRLVPLPPRVRRRLAHRCPRTRRSNPSIGPRHGLPDIPTRPVRGRRSRPRAPARSTSRRERPPRQPPACSQARPDEPGHPCEVEMASAPEHDLMARGPAAETQAKPRHTCPHRPTVRHRIDNGFECEQYRAQGPPASATSNDPR